MKKRLLCKAAEDLRCKVRDVADNRQTYCAKREIARRDDRRRYDIDRNQDRRQYIDEDCDDNGRRSSRGTSKQPRNEQRSDHEKKFNRNNQPVDQKLVSPGRAKGCVSTPCMMHSFPDRPAKHTWAKCSENPANQKKPAKREQAYHAHDTRRPASNGPSSDDCRTDAASKSKDSSRRSVSSRRSGDSYVDNNYAVSINPSSRKRAKLNPPARKEKRTIAMLDESGNDDNNRSNKTGKLKDPLDLSVT